jgi:hypothetical protein
VFFSADLALSQEWPRQNNFFSTNNLQKITFDLLVNNKSQKMQEQVRKNVFFANRDSKTARIRQTKTNPCKIGQIRQKSARNKEPARNIFCPPDDFQIRQNFPNLAEKTAIWQRCISHDSVFLSELTHGVFVKHYFSNEPTLRQRCQMIFFKSARSNVKIHQNPPGKISQIRQKSARNWNPFRPFFTLGVVFVGFFCGFGLISRVAQAK